ncbi:MAG: tRNA lysidine(34) synthetase TilS, partial [Polaribacter sp.]
MLSKFKKQINTTFPFLKDKKLLIAISGGVDSVVLTHLLYQLEFDISLAHCNFNLREKESNLDAIFVQNLAKKLTLPFFLTSFDTTTFAKEHKQSTQIAARNLRYQWFRELVAKQQFDFLLTAHHADDNLETFFINLTRGTGLEGFTGIPAINKHIVRPLLIFSRKEILHFAKKNKIDWREDKSNASTKYVRNKIRHQIIPVLKEINPNLLETFLKTTENLQENQQIMEDCIANVSHKVITSEANLLKL